MPPSLFLFFGGTLIELPTLMMESFKGTVAVFFLLPAFISGLFAPKSNRLGLVFLFSLLRHALPTDIDASWPSDFASDSRKNIKRQGQVMDLPFILSVWLG